MNISGLAFNYSRSPTPGNYNGSENVRCVPLEGDGQDVEEHEGKCKGQDACRAGHGGKDSVTEEREVEIVHQRHQPESVG